MDIKVIVRRALDRIQGKTQKKSEVTDDFLKSRLDKNKVTAIKPQSTVSITGNLTTGIHPVTAAQATSSTWYSTTGPSTGIVAQSVGTINPYLVSGTYNAAYGSIQMVPTPACITVYGPTNVEIVRLNNDGSVTWANGIDVDEAASAFARSLSQGGELAAGITYAVKQRMRDKVFEEMIEMAKDKGSITADDLTYLHQAAKIMDKLKGVK